MFDAVHTFLNGLSGQPMVVTQSGKHKKNVGAILSALARLQEGTALQITLVEGEQGLRSALYRATRKTRRKIVTTTNGNFLYVWNKSR
jgi:hypothetical protein